MPGVYSVTGALLISTAVLSSGAKKILENLPDEHWLKNNRYLQRCCFSHIDSSKHRQQQSHIQPQSKENKATKIYRPEGNKTKKLERGFSFDRSNIKKKTVLKKGANWNSEYANMNQKKF